MMRLIERMLTGRAPIRTPAVMHTDPMEVFEDPDGIQGLFAAFGMDHIAGQLLSCTDMHPVEFADDRQSGFVLMHHVCTREGRFDLQLQWVQGVSTALHQPLKGAHTPRRSGSLHRLVHRATTAAAPNRPPRLQRRLHTALALAPREETEQHFCCA